MIGIKGIIHHMETTARGCRLCGLWKKQFFTFVSMRFLIVILLNIAITFIGKLTKPIEPRNN